MILPHGPNCWIGLGAFRDLVRSRTPDFACGKLLLCTSQLKLCLLKASLTLSISFSTSSFLISTASLLFSSRGFTIVLM